MGLTQVSAEGDKSRKGELGLAGNDGDGCTTADGDHAGHGPYTSGQSRHTHQIGYGDPPECGLLTQKCTEIARGYMLRRARRASGRHGMLMGMRLAQTGRQLGSIYKGYMGEQARAARLLLRNAGPATSPPLQLVGALSQWSSPQHFAVLISQCQSTLCVSWVVVVADGSSLAIVELNADR